MAGPWEKYRQQPPASAGPWEQYAQQSATQAHASQAQGVPAAEPNGSTLGNAALGVVRGVADVGDTLINAAAYLPGKVLPAVQEWNDGRRASLQSLDDEKADSTAYSLGRIGGNIATTWPVGGALAAGARAALPASAQAVPAVAHVIRAVETSGAAGVPIAARIAGGAITGGAAAGLVDPDSALMGAGVGGVAPPVLAGIGLAGNAVAKAGRSALATRATKDANRIATAAGITPQEVPVLAAALRQGGELVPGSKPTAAQLAMTPGMSQLERTVRDAGGRVLQERKVAQNAARVDALGRVAPVGVDAPTARQDFGELVERAIRPAYEAEGRRVSALYDAVDPQGATRIDVPIDDMRDAIGKYLGPGTFGSGSAADAAIGAAKGIAGNGGAKTQVAQWVPQPGGGLALQFVDQAAPARPGTWKELQNLRSSLGEAAEKARIAGDKAEAAALESMRGSIDDAFNQAAASGAIDQGVIGRWQSANKAHAEKIKRFQTGPQAAIFRKGADGTPQAQGGELYGKFFSARPSQVEDARSFNRLAGGDNDLIRALRSAAVTEADSTRGVTGELGGKYVNWLAARQGAVGESFEPGQVNMLRAISEDIQRAAAAERLGMAAGSNTAQNAHAALRLGLLDNQLVTLAAAKMPLVNPITGALLDTLRKNAREATVNRLAEMLADPAATAATLERLRPGRAAQAAQTGQLAAERAAPLVYRGLPVLASDR